ncbi:6-phosphogluconolactonase-like [Sinocyclocheilus grahami]|uniref:6-phosphogluconolactonase-like n=1 Tax=Sinocyclocheilus grahami TaxID=75366 RepID=UPI0007ACAB47|nr:PREDICTED: 6-phosphogluconolactonase-like [Sinocyclocheilus grahami]
MLVRSCEGHVKEISLLRKHSLRIMSGRRVVVFPSVAELGATLAQLVSSRAEKALRTGASFSLGLSGGSLVSILSKELPAVPNLDCSRWLIGFCDERLVPFSDPESTYGLYKVTRKAFNTEQIPVFDMLLLGMGPDGHTCSLFPDHPLLQESQRTVAPISDSPKPPPQRVTMTLPTVNAARCVVFVSTGGSKAPVLKQVLEGGEGPALPAALVAPRQGELFWLVDEPAAASLTSQVERPGPGAKL